MNIALHGSSLIGALGGEVTHVVNVNGDGGGVVLAAS